MKITSLKLENFRGISKQEFVFDNKCTVFFGVNGVGKSTVLRAINLLYSSIINKIVHNRFKQGINIQVEDIKFGSTNCGISSTLTLDNEHEFKYGRYMKRGVN